MTDFPEDIRATSYALYDQLDQIFCDEDIRRAIASGILAERERCALIAEGADELVSHWGNHRDSRIARGTCKAIVDAIRITPAGKSK